jgi:hypothetical protein
VVPKSLLHGNIGRGADMGKSEFDFAYPSEQLVEEIVL